MARLFVQDALIPGARINASDAQNHYLLHILRAGDGADVSLFNGQDGEWRARLAQVSKKTLAFQVMEQTRKQSASPDVWLLFAPVKNEKIDYTVKRATELGVSRFVPVLTQRTIVSRVNTERLRANVVEAAEQCERLDVPEVDEPRALFDVLGAWPSRPLFFCDETGQGEGLKTLLPRLHTGPCAVLIGPEGGFTPQEREAITGVKSAQAMHLGPRILRAETAALAALAALMPWIGDWHEHPRFGG